jgi:CTP synthase
MEKVSMFCHVSPSQVLGVHNVNSTYHVPLLMRDQGLVDFLTKRLKLNEINVEEKRTKVGADLLTRWKDMTLGYVIVLFIRIRLKELIIENNIVR